MAVNKTSKSQLKAVSNWNARNPLNVLYNSKKRSARSFVCIDLKGNTKGAQAINENRDRYIEDLEELESQIHERLKELKNK